MNTIKIIPIGVCGTADSIVIVNDSSILIFSDYNDSQLIHLNQDDTLKIVKTLDNVGYFAYYLTFFHRSSVSQISVKGDKIYVASPLNQNSLRAFSRHVKIKDVNQAKTMEKVTLLNGNLDDFKIINEGN